MPGTSISSLIGCIPISASPRWTPTSLDHSGGDFAEVGRAWSEEKKRAYRLADCLPPNEKCRG
jgi:hypothetical protein